MALGLAWGGYSLLTIAVGQTLCWWLGLAASAWAYRRQLGALRPAWQPTFAREFLAGGALLALASALLAWMGPGLIIAVRHFLGDGRTLGEAALVIQVMLMLGQALRMVTNATLPFLTRPGNDITRRQQRFAANVWHLAFYLGGACYLLGTQVLPGLVSGLLGASFQPAGELLAQFSWILILLGLIQTLRLLMIGRGLYRQYLIALMLGSATLALTVTMLATRGAVSLPAPVQRSRAGLRCLYPGHAETTGHGGHKTALGYPRSGACTTGRDYCSTSRQHLNRTARQPDPGRTGPAGSGGTVSLAPDTGLMSMGLHTDQGAPYRCRGDRA